MIQFSSLSLMLCSDTAAETAMKVAVPKEKNERSPCQGRLFAGIKIKIASIWHLFLPSIAPEHQMLLHPLFLSQRNLEFNNLPSTTCKSYLCQV